ncbi:MAG: peptidoglycan DD-metalloendopeptidase family protein [Leptolyngbyaceae cyanobacterium T60_A2020_046]|nr:peptidoglycan DD-metalloendopeptidase family protein [Leptolyngbyaceae cyanobacterium T60_A2020_046]
MAIASFVTFAVTLGYHAPGFAYDVVIQPSSPRQGDTISILVTAKEDPSVVPTVTVNDETYPTFEIREGQFRTFVPTSPVHPSGRYVIRVTGVEAARNPAVWLSDRSFRVQRITLPPGRSNLGTDHEFDRVADFKALMSPEKFWQTPMVRPAEGRVSTEYGVRRYYNGVFAQNYYHRGIDYAAPTGTPVVAPAAGRVALVGRVADGFELHGNTIGIDHGQGVSSIFLHLNSISVREGDVVQPGQAIGTIGNTGASTGPHLHWGFYVNGISVDPVPWLTGRME